MGVALQKSAKTQLGASGCGWFIISRLNCSINFLNFSTSSSRLARRRNNSGFGSITAGGGVLGLGVGGLGGGVLGLGGGVITRGGGGGGGASTVDSSSSSLDSTPPANNAFTLYRW